MFYFADFVLTEAHAAQALKNREDDDKTNFAFTFDSEDDDHENKNQGGLSAHHDKLGNDMGEKNFPRRYTSYPTSIQQTFHSLDDKS